MARLGETNGLGILLGHHYRPTVQVSAAARRHGPYILSVRLRKGALGGEVLLKHFVKEVAMVAAQVNGFKEIEAELKILQRVE